MGHGRKMTLTVLSARGLSSTSNSPYVVVCFDGITQHELCRTTISSTGATTTSVWNESFTLNMSESIQAYLSHGHTKPKQLTFVIRSTPNDTDMGYVTISLKTLMTTGGVDGEYEIHNCDGGVLRVKAAVRKAKMSSMIGAGATGAAAAGGLLGFLAVRNRRRKRRERGSHGGVWNGGGVGYGYHDSSSSEEDGGGLLNWWDMHDVSSEEEDDNVFNFNESWSSSEGEEEKNESSSSSSSSSSDDAEDDDYDDYEDDDGGSE